MSFDLLSKQVEKRGPSCTAVVGAAAPEVLEAVRMAVNKGITTPVMIGNAAKLRQIANELHIKIDDLRIEHVDDDDQGASMAMDMVKSGEVHALMKGRIPTWILMRVGLKQGLRIPGGLMTHLTMLELKDVGRTLLVTDGALTPYPTFDQRIMIIKNAVQTMRRLGVEQPRVALLSASEEVNEKIPFSVEAAKLTQMNQPGGLLENYGIIEGPLDLGSALDEHTATVKNAMGRVEGKADILVAPDIIAANILSKAMIYLTRAKLAAVVVGGIVPIAMVSRASPAIDKYHSLLLALACR